MTYGHWLDQALDHLDRAHDTMVGNPPSGAPDLAAAIVARSRVYLGLARLTELIHGGPPANIDVSPDRAEAIVARQGEPAARLYVGLRTAGRVEPSPIDHAVTTSAPARHLTAAADAIATAGDIVASHLNPGHRRPSTAEGAAIRTGAAAPAGLADLARLTNAAVAVDVQLPGWTRTNPTIRPDEALRSAAAAASWATAGGLARLTRDIGGAHEDRPHPLRLLDLAPAADRRAAAITSIDEAAAAFAAARDWLYRNPSQIRAVHLTAATRLAVTMVRVGTDDAALLPPDQAAWRRAADAARNLYGSPASGPAADVANDLVELTRWVRRHAREARPALARLVAGLPTLAQALHTGVRTAVDRGELFATGAPRLVKPAGANLYYATSRWRPARPDDQPLPALRRALSDVARATTSPHLEPTAAQLARQDTATAGTMVIPAGRNAYSSGSDPPLTRRGGPTR